MFFLEFSCFFDNPMDIGNLISSAFSKFSLNMWKLTVHVLLKPGLENFELYFASMLDECNWVSLEGLMLKLKLQYFVHLMRRVDSLEKTLMLGGIGGRQRRGWRRMRRLDGITDSMDMSLNSRSWWWTGSLACCDSWDRKESDTTEQLNWTELLCHQRSV